MDPIDPKPVLDAIYSAVDEVNDQLPPEKRLAKDRDTVLVGEGGALDSLGLLSFLASTEDIVRDVCGIDVSLTVEDAPLDETGPLHTLGSLADFITRSGDAGAHG